MDKIKDEEIVSRKTFFGHQQPNGDTPIDNAEKNQTPNYQDYGTSLEPSSQKGTIDNEEKNPAEGGWGWVVCATAIMVNGTVLGFLNSMPIFYVAILTEFGEDIEGRSCLKSSWIGAMIISAAFLFAPVAGVLSDRFGIPKVGFAGGVISFLATLSSAFVTNLGLLSFTFGFLLGVGFAFPFALSIVILGHYFQKHLGLVTSLMMFFASGVSVLFSLVLPLMINSMGLKKTMLCFSAFNAFMMVYPLAWVPVRHTTSGDLKLVKDNVKESNEANKAISSGQEENVPILSDHESPRKGIFNAGIWRNSRYVVWVIGCTIGQFGYFVAGFHIVKYSEDKFPEHNANILPVLNGIALALASLLIGFVADLGPVKRHYIHVHQLTYLIIGITTIAMTFTNDFMVFQVAAGLLGICDGVFFVLVGPIVLSLVELVDSSQAVGFFMGLSALPHGFGLSIAAGMYDYFGSYTIAFRVMAVPTVAGALLLSVIDLL